MLIEGVYSDWNDRKTSDLTGLRFSSRVSAAKVIEPPPRRRSIRTVCRNGTRIPLRQQRADGTRSKYQKVKRYDRGTARYIRLDTLPTPQLGKPVLT